jgi:hypothetical protein
LNRSLVPLFNEATGRKYHLDFDVQAIDALNKDNSEKVDWLSKAWWLTADEKRIEMGYQPVGDNNRYIPMNLIPDATTELTDDDIKMLKNEYGS